jgi:type IV pilus assembly protein PilM
MRPVFAELVQEIQRSIGYYTSLHRESRFKKVIGLGNGFKLPGLQKYLEQNLGFPVVRIDSYSKLAPAEGVNLAAFNENVLTFAVAYGLALQGLGAAKIYSNLLPTEISRRRIWSSKKPWFVASAAALLIGFGGWAYRAFADKASLETANNATLAQVKTAIDKVERVNRDLSALQGKPEAAEASARKYGDMLKNNDFWEYVHGTVSQAISNVAKDQPLQTPAGLDKLKEKERAKRDVINVTYLWKVDSTNVTSLTERDINMDVSFTPISTSSGSGYGGGGGAAMPDVPMEDTSSGRDMMMGGRLGRLGKTGGGGARPPEASEGARPGTVAPSGPAAEGFILYMKCTVPKKDQDAIRFVNDLKNTLIEVSKQKPFSDYIDVRLGAIKLQTKTSGTNERSPADPLTGEDTSGDQTFTIGWVVSLKGGPASAAGSPAKAPVGGN